MTHVVISSDDPRETYDTPAPQATFTIPFAFFDVTDIRVIVDGVDAVYNSSPATSLQFSVTGTPVDGGFQGGSITLGAAVSGVTVIVYRDVPSTRTTDFPYPSPTINIKELNTQIDRIFALFQQVFRDLGRSARLAVSSTLESLIIPDPVPGQYLRGKSDGTGYEFAVIIPENSVATASETVAGIAEIATTAEVTTGTDDTRILSVLKAVAAFGRKAFANTWTALQTISLTGAGTAFTIESTAAGSSSGPNMVISRNNAAGANNDNLGRIEVLGKDNAGNVETYGLLQWLILTATNGAEDSIAIVRVKGGGANQDIWFDRGGIRTPALAHKGAGALNLPGVYINGHGTVAQVVSNTNATYQTLGNILPLDNTIPQITEGDQIHSLSITPTNASSTLRFTYTGMIGATSVNTEVAVALFVGATANALTAAASFCPTTAFPVVVSFQYEEPAGSTSSRTYTVRAGSALAGDAFLNGDSTSQKFGGVPMSVLKIEEILPQ